MNKKEWANIACLLTAMIWGFGFIATASALETFPFFTTLALRFSGASLLYWMIFWFFKPSISKKGLCYSVISGFFLFMAFTLQTIGLKNSDAGTNAFLTSVNVVLVPYLMWMLFHKKPRGIQCLASFLCLAGILLMSCSEQGLRFRNGDWFSLGCAFFFAFQIIANDKASKEADPIAVNACQMSVAALLSIPCALMVDSWPEIVSIKAVLSMAYSILFATGVAYFLQTWAQKYTDASSASLLLSTECLFANFFAILVFHEVKTWTMYLGGGLIFVSILLVEAKGLRLSNPLKKSKISSEEMG
ncbi:DMT family transporter [Dubosiella newyorkensis]|uniref:EamA domain-containing protein n=1 Tax=Dubosiella newyorkensis TaxID=1862672 RepID=A0A1U7NQE5_9FIRM|nr:DMT family transporter [Dubosiella newyorkensis]OLU47857.1 hypothetical protein BO225_01160 [Dubosiella newyorkensis]